MGAHVYFPEPNATDNSGTVTITRTYIPGDIFYFGETRVYYHFEDPSGNEAECNFSVYLQGK